MKFTSRQKQVAANGNLPIASRLFYMALIAGKSERLEDTLQGSVQGQIAQEANDLVSQTLGSDHLKSKQELPDDFFEAARNYVCQHPEKFRQAERLQKGLDMLEEALRA